MNVPRPAQRTRIPLVVGLVVGALLLGACSAATTPTVPAPTPGPADSSSPAASSPAASGSVAPASPSTPATTTKLTVGLGYIPSVQFAPFYLAAQAGYYRDAGLDVTFQNGNDADLVRLVGTGSVDIGLADGTSVIPAVSQGIPVRYVATIYAKFPNVVLARTTSGITTAADLKGKKLGTPGKYGSSWIMLQALLSSAGLTTSDLDVQLYPDYGQGTALGQGAVQAATGFANNEPVQLGLAGIPTTVLTVDDIVPLPGNGLIASVSTISAKHAALAAFVAATLRAMKEITADPSKGLDASIVAVPDLGKDRATQQAILAATIGMWSNAYTGANGLGAIDPSAWTKTVTFMAGLPGSPIGGPAPTVDQLVDTSLLAP
ncbi:MAG TPA: ABC transporter substrate-binding protein [Candidatus Binatia bacterium]|nr:ABC transporter substrate-binding protein [Candidatus Binatia bacterium]